MNEAEWRECINPDAMLDFLRGRASERKRRLFACACCRRIPNLLDHEPFRRLLEVAEARADGELNARQHEGAWGAAGHAGLAAPYWVMRAVAGAARPDRFSAIHAAWCARMAEPGAAEESAQCDLLRDLFGHLFRPAAGRAWAAWQDGTVVTVARSIYQGHSFAELPVLADALEEAGCDDADVLGHLRGAGPHARGCWVLDWLLGKE
jgi:hypothetical protein